MYGVNKYIENAIHLQAVFKSSLMYKQNAKYFLQF